jgi:hypothetical protein
MKPANFYRLLYHNPWSTRACPNITVRRDQHRDRDHNAAYRTRRLYPDLHNLVGCAR